MLVLKVRGDGRSYLLNIASKGYFDVMWHDVYHYALYTRGGPYWQITKVTNLMFFYSNFLQMIEFLIFNLDPILKILPVFKRQSTRQAIPPAKK